MPPWPERRASPRRLFTSGFRKASHTPPTWSWDHHHRSPRSGCTAGCERKSRAAQSARHGLRATAAALGHDRSSSGCRFRAARGHEPDIQALQHLNVGFAPTNRPKLLPAKPPLSARSCTSPSLGLYPAALTSNLSSAASSDSLSVKSPSTKSTTRLGRTRSFPAGDHSPDDGRSDEPCSSCYEHSHSGPRRSRG